MPSAQRLDAQPGRGKTCQRQTCLHVHAAASERNATLGYIAAANPPQRQQGDLQGMPPKHNTYLTPPCSLRSMLQLTLDTSRPSMTRLSSTRCADASASCLIVTARSVWLLFSKFFCGRQTG